MTNVIFIICSLSSSPRVKGFWGLGQRWQQKTRGQSERTGGDKPSYSSGCPQLFTCVLPASPLPSDSWLSRGTIPSPLQGPCHVGQEAGINNGDFLGVRPHAFPRAYDLCSVGSRRRGVSSPSRVTGFCCLPDGNNRFHSISCVPAEAQIGGDLSTVTQRAGICSHVNPLVILSFGWSIENKHFYLSPLNLALYMMELDTDTSSFEARVQQRGSGDMCRRTSGK